MKQTVLALSALLVAVSSFAQGQLNFSNRVLPDVDAIVTYAGDSALPAGPAGSGFWGQLLAGPVGGALAPIGAPVEFRNDVRIGYITAGGAVSVGTVAPGSDASVQMVAWHKSLGNDYAAAVAANQGGVGASSIFTVTTGGAGSPPSLPANLVAKAGTTPAFAAFSVSTLVPEPTIAALGLLGAGLLMIRRKK
jgi:hypothetical protein